MAFDRTNFHVLAQGGLAEEYNSTTRGQAKICVYTSADDLVAVIGGGAYFLEIASGGDDPILTANTFIHVIDSGGNHDVLTCKTAAQAAAGTAGT